ncbi:MAG: GDP-mannose 4,6-dehydratase [Thermoanaerobaculales bacterium]|jgi:GDP-4-dehydro-6-deoxy-D-mannose reductase|nr:GDP-mannose 4,6-dehydratase [Thermoanaerobaculales bacterium]
MRTLITGVTGFVGTHLAAELHAADPGVELWGLAWGDYDRAPLEAAAPGIRLFEGDLVDQASTRALLEQTRPDAIYHLAAASSVARSWDYAARSIEINAIGTANLLTTILELGLDPVVTVSSTAEVYGRTDSPTAPLTERAPIAPVSPYGTSKAAQDLLTGQFHTGRGLATVRVRFFHLSGPGRPPHFVASSFARQIARAELGLAPPVLEVGNLESVRDFTDVRDAVRACRWATDRRHAGEVFNVCTGRAVVISEVVELLRGLSRVPITVEVDRSRLRQADIPWMVGDPTKIEAATGWRAEIPLRQTLSDLLDWWRARESRTEPPAER